MSLPEALDYRFDTQWQELEREQIMAHNGTGDAADPPARSSAR
jgi:hypothetical protein